VSWGFVVPWLLATGRVTGFLLALPALGGPRVPAAASAGLTLFVAASAPLGGAVRLEASSFAALWVKELAVGLFLGWGIALAFVAVQVGGQVAELTLGLGSGQLVDPVHGHESTVLAQLWSTLALVVYLAADAHHQALRLLGLSFDRIRPDQFPALVPLVEAGFELFAASFLAGVQVAAPFVAASMAVEAALALGARAAPQVNVFLVSLPLKVGLALVLVGAFLPHTLGGVTAVWERALTGVEAVVRRWP
jgi:flagellar biosynthetic protein FliR